MAGFVMVTPVFAKKPPARESKRATAIQEKEAPDVARIIARYPQLAVDNEVTRNLNEKYASFARMMTPSTARNMVKLIRSKLEDDVEYWSLEASRPPLILKKPPVPSAKKGKKATSDPNAMRIWKDRQAAQVKKERQANENLSWLTVTLPGWLAEVEKVLE